ncbi:hypothetical protein L6241_07070 [Janibacter sp. Y6]|uniref:hypothetical protein n=1 Tax=Janibacter sp. Y6 TaxID=2913552 RepID=UPI0034A36CCD
MQYELKTQVIETQRHTFDHVAAIFGDRPATRYQEGSVNIQPKENFHYAPMWAPQAQLFGDDFSAFALSDPNAFLDPRQYYYAPYVANRAEAYDSFKTSLDYIEDRDLLGRLPQDWKDVVSEVVIPMRHYESGAQLILTAAARFSNGSALAQCLSYAGFDRTGNAQVISRIGIALGGGTADQLATAKTTWLEDDALQPLREHMEKTICVDDWGVGLVTLYVLDEMLYDLLYVHLEDKAVTGGAAAYSLAMQHLAGWLAEQRTWIEKLFVTWREDPQTGAKNTELLASTVEEALGSAEIALRPVAEKIDRLLDAGAVEALAAKAEQLRAAHVVPTTA